MSDYFCCGWWCDLTCRYLSVSAFFIGSALYYHLFMWFKKSRVASIIWLYYEDVTHVEVPAFALLPTGLYGLFVKYIHEDVSNRRVEMLLQCHSSIPQIHHFIRTTFCWHILAKSSKFSLALVELIVRWLAVMFLVLARW